MMMSSNNNNYSSWQIVSIFCFMMLNLCRGFTTSSGSVGALPLSRLGSPPALSSFSDILKNDKQASILFRRNEHFTCSPRPLSPTIRNTATKLQMTPEPDSLLTSISQTMALFSRSAMQQSSPQATLEAITNILSTTPPMAYFACLVAAGFGVPLSEDALCIFAGTILPTIWNVDSARSKRLLLALYGGIVVSDVITFTIGRLLKTNILKPLRNRMDLQTERVNFCEDNGEINEYDFDEDDEDEDEDEEVCTIETPKLRKRDKILSKLESAGDYAGLVIRFSVGFRTPMMLITGFSGKVSFPKYFLGTAVGALGSLSLQLLFGYTMRNNPAGIVAAIASISTVVMALPVSAACISSANAMWNRYQLRQRV